MTRSKKKAIKSTATSEGDITDPRFVAAATRPQFKSNRKFHNGDSDDEANLHDNKDRHANKKKTKAFEESFGESLTAAIRSDDRFTEALTNQEKFGCMPLMDKYGRKTKKKKSKDEDHGGDVAEENEIEEPAIPAGHDMESRIAYLNALSRGEISVSSSEDDSSDESSEGNASGEEDSDDNSSASIDVHGKAGVFDPSYNQLPGDVEEYDEDIELIDSPTPYMAILNLDWTNIRAVDIYAMLHSFCPPGTLKKVEVYPSDFGMGMMEKERVYGPSGLWKKPKNKNDTDLEESGNDELSYSKEGSEGDDSRSDDSAAVELENENISDDDAAEDIMNLNEATAKLYSHFPPQSEISKNSRYGGDDDDSNEEGFDREKLRAYEASKLRYYFAIATFSSPGAAEKVYNDVDGMEMEHSAAEINIRALPSDEYDGTIEGRELRDECDHLPGKYAPPDTVVAALRQSRVSCSWETGDAQRDKKLTKWGMGKDAWKAMAEGDDIKFYLASDHSSAEEVSDVEESNSGEGAKGRTKQTKQKADKMRSLLGLGGSDDDEVHDDESEEDESSIDESESSEQDESSTKQVTFTPGKGSLEEKIRSKINNTENETEESTPFQKYLEKRKQKRKERKEAARNKKDGVDMEEDHYPEDDGMYGYDPEFGMAKFSDEESGEEGDDMVEMEEDDGHDNFFLEDINSAAKKSRRKNNFADEKEQKSESNTGQASTKEELELLIAGDDGTSLYIQMSST